MKQQITEIMEHDIKWHLSANNVPLNDSDIEHIEYQIGSGYTSGELNVSYGKNNEKETSGWWELINWKDIALGLYNSIANVSKDAQKEAQRKAVKNFNENWLY